MEKRIVVPAHSVLEIREDIGPEPLTIEIEVQAGAHLKYVTESNTAKRTATVHADAKIIWFDINKNKNTQSEIVTKLIEPGARAETYGIFYGEDDANFTIAHTTEHLAPNTHSIMATKGVLDGKSRTTHTSLIKIHPGMNGCTGHERIDTLLLSKNAHIDAVPELEIGNNDVQCTHAVTTTRLSPEKLFYLEGRGLSDEESKKMLIEAHLSSIQEKMSYVKS